jgi:hypothetical protein
VVADLRQRSQVWRCLHRKQLKGLSHEMDLAFDDMMITVVKGIKRVRAHCLIFFLVAQMILERKTCISHG